MPTLQLKPTYKVVKAYYDELHNLQQLSLFTEGAVSPTFAALLRHCAGQFDWTLAEQFTLKRKGRNIRVDGALLDPFKLLHGVWEAKDTHDDLEREVEKKFNAGYPQDNILFQAPQHAILWQDGYEVLNTSLTHPTALVDVMQQFFAYQPPAFEQWEQAVAEFKVRVPDLATGLLNLIRAEYRTNLRFIRAFDDFAALCRQTLNPNIAIQAVEEMLIQHLLTERIFRKVFDNPDFVERNIIAHEIERVIQALTSQHFSRHSFLHPLDRFYGAIEETAATIDDYSEKQGFLNTVYEQFFQGFSVKVADTHGIVYTPQPIVDFMVLSVEDILRREFDRSLSDEGIHLLDPFVGTGNFILRVMRQIRRSALPYKYAHELHCNEVMLLPYYIAAMNIEHTYYELTGEYHPFDGLCLVDTFELAEQQQMSLFSEQNTERVARQKAAPIFVVIGNPPYNAHQVNENDNSKNRKYAVMDRRVYETYAKDSNATLVNQLSDPYAKAFRWSTDRIGDEGIVALVTNNSFLDGVAFDGMRKHLAQDFDAIYILDLGGNVRKNPKLSGTTHNVFGIQVGVSISLLVKRKDVPAGKPGTIYYARVGEDWRKEAKYEFLAGKQHIGGVEWQILQPNSRHTWLTEGMSEEFGTFLPMGTKDDKSADGDKTTSIFKTYSNSVKTNNDAYVYNFNQATLNSIAQDMVNVYNFERYRWTEQGMPKNLDEFLRVDETKLKWIRRTKRSLLRGLVVNFDPLKVRRTLYRPFCQQFYFFERIFSEDIYQLPSIFPSTETEAENCTICVSQTSEKPFTCLATNIISDHVVAGGFGAPTQCFPFYTYAEDGSDRRENITDWALAQFRAHYADEAITKWDIFHYVYAILHHPVYRETYASNLKRDLPHIPFAPATSASLSAGFWPFVEAGRKLAELHVHYEDQPQYPLQWIENDAAPLTYRVEKMRLAPDKTALIYNDFLTLAGIPPEAFAYRLGNRSALDWVIDRYRVTTDARSGIVNDPNRLDDPQYIVRLIGQVITVSVETVKIVNSLPELGIETAAD